MKRTTILFTLHSADRSGASIYAEKIIRYLHTNKPEYRVIVHSAHDEDLLDSLRNLGVMVLGAGRKTRPGAGKLNMFHRIPYYLRYAYILLRVRPDLVYSNTIINFGQVFLSKVFGAKTIVHVHEGRNFAEAFSSRLKLSQIFTDEFIAVSRYAADVLYSLTKRNAIVIHNGIDSAIFSDLGSSVKAIKTIAIIGAIDRNKGHLLALKALNILLNKKHANVVIKIIGKVNDEKYFNELQRYVISEGLDKNVIYSGVLVGPGNIYSGIDCVVSSSYDEAFPLVSLESMACGIVLVASNTGGNAELIKDGVNGLLYPVGNYEALAEQLYRVISDNELQGKITDQARKYVSERYVLADKLELIAKQIAVVLGR